MYRRNNNMTKTMRCGIPDTPDTTLTSLLWQPSTIMWCDRFDRNCVNSQCRTSKATGHSVYRMPWWLTLSKAALKWICTILDSCPLCNAFCSVREIYKSASQVPQPFQYAYSVVGSTPLHSINHQRCTYTSHLHGLECLEPSTMLILWKSVSNWQQRRTVDLLE